MSKAAMMLRRVSIFLGAAGVFAPAASAQTLPAGFTQTQIAGGLTTPTAMALAPDGRVFVCQQNGQLRVVKDGALLATPAATLSVDSVGERGLIGITFDPDFATNNHLYLHYTATSPTIHNRVSRFTLSGDTVVPGSEVPLLDLETLGPTNHNGGALHFGPDGKLYVGVGENANGANAQTLNNRLGKMLRINNDGTIPTDNPFYNTATGDNRAIWSLGLRNPFTFAFQPGTGRMFINDVGEATWEEINEGAAGANYGWPGIEGPRAGQTPPANYRDPLYAYRHGSAAFQGRAIAGGAFYNPVSTLFPAEYTGDYFFGDNVNNWINVYDPVSGTVSEFARGTVRPVDLRVAGDGSLFYLGRGSTANAGGLYRIAAIPEPSTLLLAGLVGGAGLLVRRRRF